MPNVLSAIGLVKDGEKAVILNMSNARQVDYDDLEQMTTAQKQGVIICPNYPLDEGNMIPATAISYNGRSVGDELDNVARKADLTNLDLTGTTNTTGSTIPSDKFFYLNGTLVKAKTDIANGATFTLNTNYKVVTAGGLNDVTKKWARLSLDTRGSISHSVTINEDDKDIYIEVSYVESNLSICLPIILPRNVLSSNTQVYALPCLSYDANNISSGAVNVSLSGNTLNYEIRWLMVDGNNMKNSAYIVAMAK